MYFIDYFDFILVGCEFNCNFEFINNLDFIEFRILIPSIFLSVFVIIKNNYKYEYIEFILLIKYQEIVLGQGFKDKI